MTNSDPNLYTSAEIRALEKALIEGRGVPGYELMGRAGQALFEFCRRELPKGGRVLTLCGPGNNGGDGYVAARLLRQAGYAVELISLADPEKLRNEAARAFEDWRTIGGRTALFEGSLPDGADLVIDALLGIGLERPLAGDYLAAVRAMNDLPVPVLAVDIPSGLTSESGQPLDEAVRATATLTFIGLKLGLFSGRGPDYCGVVHCADLGASDAGLSGRRASVQLFDDGLLSGLLPRRARDAHKGHFGHVLAIGGENGLSGAVRMAAEAAARVGAGLVSVATREAHAALVSSGCPVVMAHGAESGDTLRALIDAATVVAIGPGLGRRAWGRNCWEIASAADKPMVVDADALNLLAEKPGRSEHWILTPHPGEAARLLDTTTKQVQADRVAAVKALQRRYGGVVALKGAGTLVADGETVTLCQHGNPGMATGGMGDVLTGVIAGLLAQGLNGADAARAGVQAHALAGDRAAGDCPRGLLAPDLLSALRRVVNPEF